MRGVGKGGTNIEDQLIDRERQCGQCDLSLMDHLSLSLLMLLIKNSQTI